MSKSWPTLIDIKGQEDFNKVQDEGSWREKLPKHTLVSNSPIHKLSKIVLDYEVVWTFHHILIYTFKFECKQTNDLSSFLV